MGFNSGFKGLINQLSLVEGEKKTELSLF